MGAIDNPPLLTRHRLSVADYYRMAEVGIFAPQGYTITEVMSGLVTPRGLAFAPDGSLYVTEVGSGGGIGAPSLDGGTAPEPGTWALMAGGLAVLVFAARRRRH